MSPRTRPPLTLLLRNEITVRWREMTGETKPATLVITALAVLGLVLSLPVLPIRLEACSRIRCRPRLSTSQLWYW